MKALLWSERQLNRWSEERFYLVLLLIVTAAVALMATVLALNLHRNFLSIACDTAAYQNTIVNLLHGNGFRDTAYNGPQLLGIHSMFILVLLAPLYSLMPTPDLLFVLQIGGVYSAVIPVYLIAGKILRRPLLAFFIAILALVSPLLLHMALAPFHPESWILPSVFWSYYFYLRQHQLGFWLSFALACSTGEQAALSYIALGLALGLSTDELPWRKSYALYALAGGLGWLVFSIGFLIPVMHHSEQLSVIGYHYSQWNIQTVGELGRAVLTSPSQTILYLASPVRWLHLLVLVGGPLLLVLLSRRAFLLLAPFPIFFLMSDQEFFLYFHAYYYQFAFVAGYLALIFFLLRSSLPRLGNLVLIASFLLSLLSLCSVLSFYLAYTVGNDEGFNRALHEAFAKIPADASVYGPHRYSAYLSDRPNMVMGDLRDENLDFKAMVDNRYGVTDVHADEIDYIVCDLQNDQCGWRQGGYSPEVGRLRTDNVNRLLASKQWEVFWTQNNVVILHRVGGKTAVP